MSSDDKSTRSYGLYIYQCTPILRVRLVPESTTICATLLFAQKRFSALKARRHSTYSSRQELAARRMAAAVVSSVRPFEGAFYGKL